MKYIKNRTLPSRPHKLGKVRKCEVRQLMDFRKLRLAMGETAFRDALVEGLDILSNSTGIVSPAGWLYDFIRKEAEYGK